MALAEKGFHIILDALCFGVGRAHPPEYPFWFHLHLLLTLPLQSAATVPRRWGRVSKVRMNALLVVVLAVRYPR